MLMPERDVSDGAPTNVARLSLGTERSCGIWARPLALFVQQPDTYPSPSDSTDLLINVTGVHPATWSWLAPLEQLVRSTASSPLCLKSLSERTY